MIEVHVRCWPHGTVIEGVWMQLATAPIVGDVIELVSPVELIVTSRRFSPKGQLYIWCIPQPGKEHEVEIIRTAFDEIRGSN